MKKLFLISLFQCTSCIMNCAFSQNPLVKMWDYRFGGTYGDFLYSVNKTTDGGFILGGVSSSNANGDKTQPQWGAGDYWIVKLDSLGNKQWDKDFGGIGNEVLYCVRQTIDNGFILGGISYSGISGDKTQPSWGYWDYWIVKIDSLGNMQWDKDFGGTDNDELHSIEQTADHGYILGGFSKSGISGDKTEVNRDPSGNTTDHWIIKIDSLGNKEWDKDFGGVSNDNLLSIHQTNDGGFIFGGTSSSLAGGDKTQPSWGFDDYWIVKTDSLGTKQWDKDFGGIDYEGLFAIEQTHDEGFMLSGFSRSGISGNKSQDTIGGYDYWVVKIDSLGTKQWDKDYGGTDYDEMIGNIVLTSDSGYLFSGTSYSLISGDKTEANLGPEQAWIIKTDSLGNKQWDKTLHTNTSVDDEIGLALQTSSGCFVMAVETRGAIGGDKSQSSRGVDDYWIIKFCDSVSLPPSVSFSATQNLCPGTCTDFLNLSFNATSCQWSFPGATPDTSTATNPINICYQNAGSYDVQLIATNANGSDTLLLSNYITVYPSPPQQAINQSGDTLFANAGATSYQWYFNGNLIQGATDYFYIAQASGDYNVVATDVNGCEVEAAVFNIVAEVGSGSQRPFTIFPNPVGEKLSIIYYQLLGTAGEISIYNVLGKKVFTAVDCRLFAQVNLPYCGLTVDCRLLPPGIYFLEIIAGQKNFRTKFVKR
ncbi:MAG: T9SS type A sorting domain-containing protein [Bacteroidota bacterium]